MTGSRAAHRQQGASRLDAGHGWVALFLLGPTVADYGYGTTHATEVEWLLRGRVGRKLPITVDSRYDLLTYKNLTAATPNEPEVEAAFGQSIGNDLGQLHALGRKFLNRQGLQALLVTRGRDGMALFEPRRPPRHIPVFGSDEAVDVTGAGDTVIAAFTLALAAGADFLQAALIANAAGGIVVMKRGTATVSRTKLRRPCATYERDAGASRRSARAGRAPAPGRAAYRLR